MKIEISCAWYNCYDKIIQFNVQHSTDCNMWAHMLSYDYYQTTQTIQYASPEIMDVSFTIELVDDIKLVNDSISPILKHNFHYSPQVNCIGIISKVIASNTIVCDVGVFKNIIVITEIGYSSLTDGMHIEFSGSLECVPN